MIIRLDETYQYPPHCLATPDGLLAIGGDLTSKRLITAYQQGIFPWYSEGQPILWWSPDPRMVLFPLRFSPNRSLRNRLRRCHWTVRFNYSFDQVVACCANAPRGRKTGTWLSTEMQRAYCQLHKDGYAHSVETWDGEKLVGGLYGVAIGKVFYGESMFSLTTDASKVAFCHLIDRLNQQGFELLDCQVYSDHLASLGAIQISRHTFLEYLHQLTPLKARFCPPSLFQ